MRPLLGNCRHFSFDTDVGDIVGVVGEIEGEDVGVIGEAEVGAVVGTVGSADEGLEVEGVLVGSSVGVTVGSRDMVGAEEGELHMYM